MQEPLRLEPKHGSVRLVFLLASHALVAAACLFVAELTLSHSAIICLLVFASFVYQLHANGRLGLPWRVVAADVRGQAVTLYYADGQEAQAVLLPSQYVTEFLVVLSVALRGSRVRREKRLVIFADEIDAQTFRRLRVQLRYPLHASDEQENLVG